MKLFSSIVTKLTVIQNTRDDHNAHELFLEPLQQTSQAVFQTFGPFNDRSGNTMGQKYVDLIKSRQLGTVFVGPDNRIIGELYENFVRL